MSFRRCAFSREPTRFSSATGCSRRKTRRKTRTRRCFRGLGFRPWPSANGMLRPYEEALGLLSERGRLRKLAPRAGHDFSSNDYLGLAQSEELRKAVQSALNRGVPVGAGGSRLLRGNHPEHEALEEEAA